VFRIGIMGAGSTKANVLRLLGAFEEALGEAGYKAPSSGRAAAEAAY
jgi:aspartate aminotransferase-like enzyme